MPTFPVLRTERLVLREWRDADRAPFAALNDDPVVMEYLNARLDRAESDGFADRIVARWAEDGFGLWAVEVDGEFAGYVGLARAGFEASFTPAVEVGWRLAHSYWGRGIATEAARAAVAYGFEQVGMDEIDSWTALVNVRSWRVMERLGMVRDIEFEHPLVPVGHPSRPHVLYRLPASVWRKTPSPG